MQPAVVLVAMPWPTVSEPSLGLGILKSQLRNERIRSRVFHAYIDLLRYVSFETYAFVSSCWGLNEFVFTRELDRSLDAEQIDCLTEECASRVRAKQRLHSKYNDVRSLVSLFLRLREEIVPAYLSDCADTVAREQPTLVGFTCMFDQTIASVALARLIKRRLPDVLVAFGGCAVDGAPGKQVIETFRWVDCIVSGDGEPVVGDLARASVREADLQSLPGITTRRSQNDDGMPPTRIELDSSPDPDYSDWYVDVAHLRDNSAIEIRDTLIPVESSRGCWHGQSRHCIFCGIDDEALKYRSKSPRVVLKMLKSLRRKYGDRKFRFNDYILPSAYYKTLLPDLGKVRPLYRLQCEIKANQTAYRLGLFRKAGFTDLQPGIESFSSNVLRLMDKGVHGIQNVLTLKAGYVNGVVIHYNILYGVPSERSQYYLAMLKAIPRLYHLQPPVSRSQIEVTRGAPLQRTPDRFGIHCQPRHARLYDVLFSENFLSDTGFNLDDYAYYFQRDFGWSDELAELHLQLVIQVNHWKARHRREEVILGYDTQGQGMTFFDSRFGSMRTSSLGRFDTAVYLAADAEPITAVEIAGRLGCTISDVQAVLERLDQERLIWREADKVLGLGTHMAIVREHLASHWKQQWTSLYS